MVKIIVNKLRGCLPQPILKKQFGFVFNQQIHDFIGITRERLHTIKLNKISIAVMKLDLSKAYDKGVWNFLRLNLLQVG